MARARNVLVSYASHDLRNALNVALALVELIRRQTGIAAEVRELAEGVLGSGEILRRVLDDLLEAARIGSRDFNLTCSTFNLQDELEVLRSMFRGQARQKGLSLEVAIEPGTRMRLLGDRLRLRQLLTNLVGNAVKFSSRGSVKVTAAESSGKKASRLLANFRGRLPNSTLASLSGTVLRFEVGDTGPGISRNTCERLQKTFGQEGALIGGDYGGGGWGLIIVRYLVSLMQGDLTLETVPGGGSTFIAEIPFYLPGPASLGADAREDSLERGSGLRVLIVDDSEVSRYLVKMYLAEGGCQADSADGPRDALRLFRRARYDAVLLDFCMPGRTGLHTALCMRRYERMHGITRTPIILLGAVSSLPEGCKGRVNGLFDGELSKPFTAKALVSLLWEVKARGAPGQTAGLVEPEARTEVLALFVEGAESALENLRRESASGNWLAAKAVAHGLRGDAALVGLKAIAALARRVESGARAGHVETRLFDEIDHELMKLKIRVFS